MATLITGGAGYIGTHTALEFLNEGREIVIVDNFSNSRPRALDRLRELSGRDFKFYKLDLLDYTALDKVFSECNIDSVIHFAALKAVPDSVVRPIDYYTNNVTGTLNLCRAMKEHGARRIVFSSSATVYGAPASVPIREDFPLSAVNPYGQSKLINEQIMADLYKSDNSWAISVLRYFNPIGAHPSGRLGEDPLGVPGNLLPKLVAVVSGRLEYLPVTGDDYKTHDGTGVRDYIHVVDLARAHLSALRKIEEGRGIDYFNIGTGTGYSVFEIIKAFEGASGKKVNYRIMPRRPGDIDACYADPAKAERILGWRAKYNLDDMCRDLSRWQEMNPNGYGE